MTPTIVNSSGTWYIASETKDDLLTNYIECNDKYNCYVVCDKINGCMNTIINGSISTNLVIKCANDYSCNNINLISSATNSTSLYCSGHKSCSFSNINLTRTINHIFITCSSTINEFACMQNSYYLPFINHNVQTQININCIGVGCYHFGNIYIKNNKLSNIKFYMNRCGQCDTLNECIYNYSIFCTTNKTQKDLFWNGGCDELYHIIYTNDTNSNCPINKNLDYYSTTNTLNHTIINNESESNLRTVIIITLGAVIISAFIGLTILCCHLKPEIKQTIRSKKTKTESSKHDINDKEKDKLRYNKVLTGNSETSEMNDRGKEISNNELSFSDTSTEETENTIANLSNNDYTSIPVKIFAKNYKKGLHRKSQRKHLETYSFEEVSEHCTRKSCWIVVDNLILDVTKFLKYHPGHIDSITKYGGTVCDEHFAFHSKSGKQLFWKFVIGKVHAENANCLVQ